MIVVDEQLADPRIIRSISNWYKGKVISVIEVRPHTTVPDDAIPELLRQLKAPTFVTINYHHFWQRVQASSAYCVICVKLPAERSLEVPQLLRTVFSRPNWRTKRGRMGSVISLRDRRVSYYSTTEPNVRLISPTE